MRNDVRARVINVIEVEHLRVGDGARGEPPRWVKSYFDLRGNFLSELDPYYASLEQQAAAQPAAARSPAPR